jgi:hypothetical protein
MEQLGGCFEYTAWCAECAKVTPHLHGACLCCVPMIGFPRPVVVSEDEQRIARKVVLT